MTTLSAYTLARSSQQAPGGEPGAEDWRHRAACLTEDPELWFPDGENPKWAPARRICDTCPVKALCLDAAQVEEEGRGKSYREGMRGGLTPTERWQLATTAAAGPRKRKSPRRDRVVALTQQGKTAAEIGTELGVVPRVVQEHRRRARDFGELPALSMEPWATTARRNLLELENPRRHP